MRIDEVTFVDAEVRKLSKDEFIDSHMGVLWQSLVEKERKKKLTDVYDLIVGKSDKASAAVKCDE